MSVSRGRDCSAFRAHFGGNAHVDRCGTGRLNSRIVCTWPGAIFPRSSPSPEGSTEDKAPLPEPGEGMARGRGEKWRRPFFCGWQEKPDSSEWSQNSFRGTLKLGLERMGT